MDTFVTGELVFYRSVMPGVEANMYLTIVKNKAMVVDPNECEEAFECIGRENVSKVVILLTHEHIDHISGVNKYRERFENVSVICSEECALGIADPKKNLSKFWDVIMMDKDEAAKKQAEELVDRSYICTADETWRQGFEFEFQGHIIKMIKAPGHSLGGSLIFVGDEIVFTGDNLVNGNGVITRFPGGNKKVFWDMTAPVIEKICDDCFIFPGHGDPGKMKYMRRFLVDYKR